MNIVFRTTKTFFAICQSCDDISPDAPTRRMALISAIQDGWSEKPFFNGLEHTSLTLCSDCTIEQEKEE